MHFALKTSTFSDAFRLITRTKTIKTADENRNWKIAYASRGARETSKPNRPNASYSVRFKTKNLQ